MYHVIIKIFPSLKTRRRLIKSPFTLTFVLTAFLGHDTMNVQPQLPLIMTDDAYVEQNNPVQIKKHETKAKADGSPSKTVNPFSSAALKGMSRKSFLKQCSYGHRYFRLV